MIASLLVAAFFAAAPAREVAITFDDLPNINSDLPIETQRSITTRLLAALNVERVTAIGFVNEDKLLDDEGQPDPNRVTMIAQWLDAGQEIGNHTFSHLDLDSVSPEAYEADVLRGEAITRPLVESRGQTLRWFRHPLLDTGKTIEVRDNVDAFLVSHAYRVAPVTIDSSEWMYDDAYDHAAWWQRAPLRISYVRYMRRRFAWAEAMSRLVFGRDVAQILLLHASALNADTFPRLAAMIRGRGYRFATIDEATADPAYATPEHWTGGGVGWLERWGTARGIAPSRFEHDPLVPRWVQRLAGAHEE